MLNVPHLQSDTQPIAPPKKKAQNHPPPKKNTEPFLCGAMRERLGCVLNPMDIAGIKDQNTYHW